MWRRFLCRIGWHWWSDWDTPRPVEGSVKAQQFRMCKICKKQQRHVF